MRPALRLLTAAFLAPALAGQDRLLVERVPAPLAYLSVAAGGAADGVGPEALLDDPTLRRLLIGDAATPDDPSAVAIARLRGLLALSTGELELVLTGILPRADAPALPLLCARVRLSEDGRERVAAALADPSVATPGRTIGSHRAFELVAASRPRPGALLEAVLAGRDLFVTNHVSSIEEVLAGDGQAPHADALAADPVFRALRSRLGDGPGSALLHVDWRRLRDRALRDVGAARRLLLQGIGLGSAEHVAAGFRIVDGALRTTLWIDQPDGVDGLLTVARPVAPRSLVQELPGHGVATIAFSVEPQRLSELASRRGGAGGARAASFHADLVGGCGRFGIDFDAHVAARLGDTVHCRLLVTRDDAAAAIGLRARSVRDARALFADVRERLERSPLQTEVRADATVGDVLVVAGDRRLGDGASLGVVGESVVLGLHPDVVSQIAAADRAVARRERTRAQAATLELIERILAERDLDARSVIGVLDVDGGAWAVTPDAPAPRAGRHAGLVLLDGGALRIELISPL